MARKTSPATWVGLVAFALLVGAATTASFDYEATSTTRRGAGVESLWYGAQAIVSVEEHSAAGELLIGRLLALAGLIALGFWVWLKVRARRTVAG